FWWSVLWSIGYVIATQLTIGILCVFLLVVMLMGKPDGLGRLTAPDLMQTPEFALALVTSLLVGQIVGAVGSWLAIRLIVGRSWPRQLGLRLPGATHLLLAFLALPAMIVHAGTIDQLVKQLMQAAFGKDGFLGLDELGQLFGRVPWPLAVLAIGV